MNRSANSAHVRRMIRLQIVRRDTIDDIFRLTATRYLVQPRM